MKLKLLGRFYYMFKSVCEGVCVWGCLRSGDFAKCMCGVCVCASGRGYVCVLVVCGACAQPMCVCVMQVCGV
jgi:hypothetical protein